MSKTVKHTPGPYSTSGGGYIGICAIINGVSRQIGRAEVVGTPGVISDRECEANATLFAAAPELLEALQALFVDYAESEGCYCGQIVGGTRDGYPMHICGYCIAEKAITKAGGTFTPKAEGR